jgi:hypothetical protein
MAGKQQPGLRALLFLEFRLIDEELLAKCHAVMPPLCASTQLHHEYLGSASAVGCWFAACA